MSTEEEIVEEYRRRVTAIYKHYAPEKIKAVESSLAKYKGQEDDLIDALVEKYGPEPTAGMAPPTAASPPRATSTPAAASPNPSPMRVPGQAPHGETNPLSQQQSIAFDRYGSFFGSPQESAVFTPEQQAMLDSMGPAAPAGGGGSASDPLGLGGDDDFASVRRIVRDSQFQDPEHERMWEEAWLGKLPLSTVSKYVGGEQTALLDGWGMKKSNNPKTFKKFQKRFFLLLPYFLYIFESDELTAPCKGALYMDGAQVSESQEPDGKTCIEIVSRVSQKPSQLDPNGTYGSFKLYFEASRVQEKWLQVLTQMTKVKSAGAAALQRKQSMMGQGQLRGAPSSANLLQRQQSMLAVAQGQATPPAAAQSLLPPSPSGQSLQAAGLPPTGARTPTPPRNTTPIHTTHPLAAPQAMQQQGAPPGTILVSEDNVKNRIKRLACEDRNPTEVIETLTDFICKMVCGQQEVWELMEKLEVIERGFKRPTEPVPQGALSAEQQAELIELRAAHIQMKQQIQEQASLINRLQQGGGGAAATSYSIPAPTPLSPSGSPVREKYSYATSTAVDTGGDSAAPGSAARVPEATAAPSPAATFSSPMSQLSRGNTSVGASSSQRFNSLSAVEPDQAWADRMSRIQARKQLVEQMLNDLPT